MGFVENNLVNNEQVIQKAKLHWAVYLTSMVMFAVNVFFLVVAPLVMLVTVPLFFYVLIRDAIYAKTTEFAVTNKRIIGKFGFLKRESVETQLVQLEGLTFDQGLIGRMLDYGKLSCSGTGGKRVPFMYISDPLALRKAIFEEAEKARAGTAQQGGAPAPHMQQTPPSDDQPAHP